MKLACLSPCSGGHGGIYPPRTFRVKWGTTTELQTYANRSYVFRIARGVNNITELGAIGYCEKVGIIVTF